MKRKSNRISMVVMAATLFTATLMLNVEKNQKGDWTFATAARGNSPDSEGPTTKTGEHLNLTATQSAYNGVAKGNYILFKPAGSNPGSASVTAKNLASGVWVKSYDTSAVGISASTYNISYNAYFTIAGTTGGFTALDGYQITW